MTKIIKGVDDIIYRLVIRDKEDNEFLISEFQSVQVWVFTDNVTNAVEIESEYINSVDNLIHIQADKMTTLNDGVVRLKVLFKLPYNDYPDHTLDQSIITDTCYYLKTI